VRVSRWIAAIAVVIATSAIALLDGEAGVATWLDLREEVRVSRARVALLEYEVDELSAEIEALDSDPLGLERAIREDLELARPGEWVVRFARNPGSGPDQAPTSRFP
jgi:cell division protein FtsB